MRKDSKIHVDVDRHESASVGRLNIPWPEDELDTYDDDDMAPWFRWCKRRKLDKVAFDFPSEIC